MEVTGFHHVTCIGSHPQANVDFYARVLGLRLLKRTVHFDHEDVYHLYYGDERGTPGSIITFFPFPNPVETVRGANSVQEFSLAVPLDSKDFWTRRFERHGVDHDGWQEELGGDVLRFRDHDGQRLALAAVASSERSAWAGEVSLDHAIGGIQSIEIGTTDQAKEVDCLQRHFGLVPVADEGSVARLRLPNGKHSDRFVDVRDMSGVEPAPPVPLEGAPARAGTVNHIAFGTEDATTQLAFREHLVSAGFEMTEVKDRRYFKSIYMIDPSGIRVEVATDAAPGFEVDESSEAFGRALQLPPWFEHRRGDYEKSLPPLSVAASG